jgi:regulator of sirC expression with transglutaminase-like and TPR domain
MDMDAGERFRELLTRPEAEVPLDEAAFLVAAHAYPDLDLRTELDRLDRLAEGCYAPTLDALVRYLFVDLGYRGNRRQYYDPRNSYLNDVVARRLGIPITLSVLAIAVGRRLGVPLDGVGMPGHFLLRDRVDRELFVDPFAGGVLLDRRGCEAAFRAVQGEEAPFDPDFLEPVGPHLILARLLQNLRAVFSARADRPGIIWVLRLRSAIPGVPVDERGELAAAYEATGDFGAAAGVLEGLADQVGEPGDEQYRVDATRLRARLN